MPSLSLDSLHLVQLAGSNGLGWQRVSTLAGVLLGLFLLYQTALVCYRIWFHPLSKFPGPKIMAASKFPYLWKNLITGELVREMRPLHKKYGRVVRIGPNVISVDGSIGWQEIFAHRPGGDATEFYKNPQWYSPNAHVSLIGAPNREQHRRHRRQLAHAFSDASMHEQEPVIMQYVDLLTKRLSEFSAGGKSLDMCGWLNYLTFDIIGDLAFAESFHSLEHSDYHPWVKNMFKGIRGNSMRRFFSHFGPLARPLSSLDFDGIMAQNIQNQEYSNAKANARIDLGLEPKIAGLDGGPGKARRDFMTYMMRESRDGQPGFSRDELVANSNLLIGAGSETTGTTLAALFFLLAHPRNRWARDEATAEVRAKFKREADVGLDKVSSRDLPFLHACIEEALRMHPPAAETPPRLSPGAMIDGKFVPKGTTVSIFQYATFHNPDNFADPEGFHPERFLPASHPRHDARFDGDNMAAFKPFSHGPRDCIGKNLAYAEMHLVASRILLRFDIDLAEGMHDWIDNQRAFTVWDKGELMLNLTERTDLELKA